MSEPPTTFDAEESTWGALHVYVPGEDRLERVRQAVERCYATVGLKRIPWSDPTQAISELLPAFTQLEMNPSRELGPDEVFVLPEAQEPWVGVLSRAHEWSSPGGNPLGKELSRDFDVFSIVCANKKYAEYTLYKGGELTHLSFLGPQCPAVEAGVDVKGFDPNYFEDKDPMIPVPDLVKWAMAPCRFVTLAGPDMRGHRDAFDARTLNDYTPEQFLIFR
ncbi:MAG: hypothetical protein KDD82_14445 [Planctomycetes bacterium]|nr:hypothetical protein [Planctomycetota bacterium]